MANRKDFYAIVDPETKVVFLLTITGSADFRKRKLDFYCNSFNKFEILPIDMTIEVKPPRKRRAPSD